MPLPPRPNRRQAARWCAAAGLATVLGWVPAPASAAPGIEVQQLALLRPEGGLALDFFAQIQLSPTVEEALQRGVPVYFTAQATLLRNRWYWRDERIARVQRSWRVAFQPLTSSWRLNAGGLSQSFGSLREALGAVARLSGWRIAERSQIDPDSRHYVEFVFRLDTNQLPSPMQIGLTTQGDWALSVERTLRLE